MSESRKGPEGHLTEDRIEVPSFLQLAKTFFIMGLTAYGPVILQELKRLVVKNNWLSQKEFEEGLGMVQLYPGPIMLNLATYTAYRIKGLIGASATIFFVLPSYVLVLILSWMYFRHGKISWIHPLFAVLDAIVLGIILHVALNFYLKYAETGRKLLIAVLSFLFLFLKTNAFLITFVSILLGLLFFRKEISSAEVLVAEGRSKGGSSSSAVLISGLVFLGLILFGIFEKDVLGELTLSMVKVGSIAFGNGMTIMPFLQQEAVVAHHWVNMREFTDGIALGQITPGPILITATFIGYKVAGLKGSVLATAGIFYPSFFYTLVMTEIYEKIKHNPLVLSAIKGLLASFTGMLFYVVFSIGKVSLISLENVLWAAAAFVAVRYLKWSVLRIFLVALVANIFIFLVFGFHVHTL